MATLAITPNQDSIDIELFIAAPPQRVFEAITDPSQVPKWWGQSGMYRTTKWQTDLRVGGKWSSDGVAADGSEFRVHGEYLEVDPPRRLVHTWIASWTPALKTVVRWELEPRGVHGLHASGPQKSGTGTVVKIHHSGFAGDSKAAQDHGNGWQRVLGWMQAFLEKGETIESRPAPASK